MTDDTQADVAKQIGRLADATFRVAKANERIALITEQNFQVQLQLAQTSAALEQRLAREIQ